MHIGDGIIPTINGIGFNAIGANKIFFVLIILIRYQYYKLKGVPNDT